MKNYRMSKGTTEHYTSLEELRTAWGKAPYKKRTKDEDKLEKQQKNFCKRHLCKACGLPMVWIGGNMMACQNEKCKGIPLEKKDADGNVIQTIYLTSYDLLDDKGAEIANNIFDI